MTSGPRPRTVTEKRVGLKRTGGRACCCDADTEGALLTRASAADWIMKERRFIGAPLVTPA
jgi:hypothetical protein